MKTQIIYEEFLVSVTRLRLKQFYNSSAPIRGTFLSQRKALIGSTKVLRGIRAGTSFVIKKVSGGSIFHASPFTRSTSCAASMTETFAVAKDKPPCKYTAYGSRRGPSADISMEDPRVNAPAAMMTSLS